jgi:hypothetical protein
MERFCPVQSSLAAAVAVGRLPVIGSSQISAYIMQNVLAPCIFSPQAFLLHSYPKYFSRKLTYHTNVCLLLHTVLHVHINMSFLVLHLSLTVSEGFGLGSGFRNENEDND